MSDGRQVLGRDEIEGYMRRFLAQWSDFRAEAEDRDRFVVTVRWERDRARAVAAAGISE